MTRALALVASLWVVLLGLTAQVTAQDREVLVRPTCAEGRERLPEGRCCWPGQRWSEERGRCDGPPTCPEDLVEHGDACIAPELFVSDAAPPPAEGATTTRPPAYALSAGYDTAARGPASTALPGADGWPRSSGRLDRPTHRSIVVRGEDEGLIMASLVVFDVGWVLGWLGTALSEGIGCRQFTGFGEVRVGCDAWPWAFIPIGGGMAAGMAAISRGSGFAFGFGIASVILQGIGGIMAIIATTNETTEFALQPMRLGESLSASVSFGAEAADAGLTFGLTF